MLKRRLIPKLLISHRQMGALRRPVLVTTRGFQEIADVGDPVSQAKIYEAQLADELIVLGIERLPLAQSQDLLRLIERLAAETFMPLCVGGGVSGVEDFDLLLERGADKVAINTEALARPALIEESAVRYGAQCVVVSIDYRFDESGVAWVFSDRGRTPTGRKVLEWATEACDRGSGELLLTDISRDGHGQGLDWATLRQLGELVHVPLVVSGGCGLAEHFVQGFKEGGADGVAAGTFFSFRDQNPMQTRAHIRNAGVPIRMET
jgi:imidazole glycerol-phosphate synthase subunit HisF